MKQTLMPLLLLLSIISFGQQPNIKWQRSAGGSKEDFGQAMCPTPTSGYMIAGFAKSTDGQVEGNHGDEDFWLVKIDGDNNLLWTKCYGGSGVDEATSVHPTADNGYIVGGTSTSNDGQVSGHHSSLFVTQDYWIIKIDSTGKLEWQRSLGGSGSDFLTDVRETLDGGYIAIGYSNSTDGDITGNHGGFDIWIVKLNSKGKIVWQKSYGGTENDFAGNIIIMADGGYVLTGAAGSNDGDIIGNHGQQDLWILKLNKGGDIKSQKCLGGSKDDFGFDIKLTKDNGYIVCGRSASSDGDLSHNYGNLDFWMLKLDNKESIKWRWEYGGSADDAAYNVIETNDGGYVAAGFTESSNVQGNHGSSDAWLFKFDNNGKLLWEKVMGSTGPEYAYQLVPDEDNGCVFAGASSGANGDVTSNHGSYDFWIVKLTPGALPIKLIDFTAQKQHGVILLQWQTASELNSKAFNVQRSIDGLHFTTIGIVAAAGKSEATIAYNYTDNNVALLKGKAYYRLQEVDNDGNHSYSKILTVQFDDDAIMFRLLPNPVKSVIRIKSAVEATSALITITDMNGRMVYSGAKPLHVNAVTEIAASGWANGSYVITIQANGQKTNLKMIKE